MPDASPDELLAAYLTAHAQGASVPAALYARGEALRHRLAAMPPATAAWGRFLVAQGEIAAESLGDDAAAAEWFRAGLESVAAHGDGEVAVTAGFDLGVLHERRGRRAQALAAYRAAASAGLRRGVTAAAALRAAMAVERIAADSGGTIAAGDATIFKLAWLAWFWLRACEPARLAGDLVEELERSLAAYVLPDPGSDDVARLAANWRSPRWAAAGLPTVDGDWPDWGTQCRRELYAAASDACRHLADAGASRLRYRLAADAVTSGQ